MADNILTKDRTDANIALAAKDVSSVLYPRNILVSPDGSDLTPLTDAALRATAVPVSGTFYQETQPVSASALPLPTGAATETTQGNVKTAVEALVAALLATGGTSTLGDKGFPALVKRRDADTSVSTDGQYMTLNCDEEGRLKVASKPASYAATVGNITANGGTVYMNTERFSNLMLHCTGTFSTVNVTFEGSLNSTNGTDGNWFTVQAIRSNANTIETATGNLSAAPAYAWELSVNALKYFRVRATAWTSGTQAWTMIPGTYATEPIPGAQVSGTQAVSGTVTVTSTRISPNAADGHSTHYHLISAASTNDTLVLTGAHAIGSIAVTNINAAARFFKLYNKATAPTSSDTPAMTVLLKPGETTFVTTTSPIRCPLGIGFRLTTGIAVADTGAVAAAEHSVSITYT